MTGHKHLVGLPARRGRKRGPLGIVLVTQDGRVIAVRDVERRGGGGER